MKTNKWNWTHEEITNWIAELSETWEGLDRCGMRAALLNGKSDLTNDYLVLEDEVFKIAAEVRNYPHVVIGLTLEEAANWDVYDNQSDWSPYTHTPVNLDWFDVWPVVRSINDHTIVDIVSADDDTSGYIMLDYDNKTKTMTISNGDHGFDALTY